MRRREFLTLIAGASILRSAGAGAQQSNKVYRIAFLHPSHPVAEMTQNSSLPYYRAFFEEFRRLGYVEGQNVLIERFSGEGHVEKYASLVETVVSRNFECCLCVYRVDDNAPEEGDFYYPDSRGQ
jgi:putative ABC transport system substrate-binding protein